MKWARQVKFPIGTFGGGGRNKPLEGVDIKT